MAKIAVFDSGLGSLSIIKAIQKQTKCEIIYFADQKNFPYGQKSKKQLEKIIKSTIEFLKKQFKPDLIIIASNTPTLLLPNILSKSSLGVLPPLKKASRFSKTNNIAVLATQSVTKSKQLDKYIQKNNLPKKIKIHKINASMLVQLVESGIFLKNKNYCKSVIKKTLNELFLEKKIDIVTLSSTHLPFLKPLLQDEFPRISFLDPADDVAKKVLKVTKPSKRNSLRIYTSGNTKKFQSNLQKLRIKNKVSLLTF